MSITTIAFFNNKGGVGKTSLVYHSAWMMTELGLRVLVADLDPQGNLTAACVEEERLEALWEDGHSGKTILGAIKPLKDGVGDVSSPFLEDIGDGLALIPGDIGLSTFEDDLSQVWPECLDGKPRAFRVISAFWRIMQSGARKHDADIILVDLGPNLGAINRAALIASDHIVIPLGPDLFSLQGLRNLGPTLIQWRKGWSSRLAAATDVDFDLPQTGMEPMGYVVMQHSERNARPVKAYQKWINRIPATYRDSLSNQSTGKIPSVRNDPFCLTTLKHYRSLMPMAQEARKPLFHLKPADGALGSHIYAVQDARKDFEKLTRAILKRAGIPVP